MAETIKINDVPNAGDDMTFNNDNKSRGKGLISFYILDFLSRVNMMVLRRGLWPACFFAKDKFFGNTHAAANTQQMLVTGWQDWKLHNPAQYFNFLTLVQGMHRTSVTTRLLREITNTNVNHGV